MVQANLYPVVENTTGGGDCPKCPKCKKTVFMAEARVAGKFKWHANCFKCREFNSYFMRISNIEGVQRTRLRQGFDEHTHLVPSSSFRRGLPQDIGLVELCRAQPGTVLQGLPRTALRHEGLR